MRRAPLPLLLAEEKDPHTALPLDKPLPVPLPLPLPPREGVAVGRGGAARGVGGGGGVHVACRSRGRGQRAAHVAAAAAAAPRARRGADKGGGDVPRGEALGVPLKDEDCSGARAIHHFARVRLRERLRGIQVLIMNGCAQATITGASFNHLRGVRVLQM